MTPLRNSPSLDRKARTEAEARIEKALQVARDAQARADNVTHPISVALILSNALSDIINILDGGKS